MKRRLKGRSHYYPGSLYGIALSMPVTFIPIFIMIKSCTIEVSKGSPAMILAAVAFIVLYLIFSKLGVKIFAFTENLFMGCGDAQKAHRKAVITEFLVFFGFIGLICVVMPMII